jgi:cytochrome c-type biogenesis protein CcmH/NrfF
MKMLSRLSLRKEPEQPKSRYAVIEDMIVERFGLRRIQAFYDDLLQLERHWLWLLPALIFYAWYCYRREREEMALRRLARATLSQDS